MKSIEFTPQPSIVFTPEESQLMFPILREDADLWKGQLFDFYFTWFQGLTDGEKMNYLDLDDPDTFEALKSDIYQDFKDKKIMKESYGNKTTECGDFIDECVEHCLIELISLLRTFQINRANQIAKGMREIFALDPNTELEGCEKMLEMAEESLSDINTGLIPNAVGGDVTYWETFRDYFAFAVAQLSCDY